MINEKEAIELGKYVNLGDTKLAYRIYEAYLSACENDPMLAGLFVFGTLFNAGRVQGIRDERKRRKGCRR